MIDERVKAALDKSTVAERLHHALACVDNHTRSFSTAFDRISNPFTEAALYEAWMRHIDVHVRAAARWANYALDQLEAVRDDGFIDGRIEGYHEGFGIGYRDGLEAND